MGIHSQIIINQILIAGIMVIIGVIAAHAKIITESVRDAISKMVYHITLPLLIFTTFSNTPLTRTIALDGGWIIFFTTVSFFIMYLTGKLTSLIFNLPPRQKAVHIVHTMFGNIVYLGFPLIYALFPQQESMVYAALYYFVSTIIMWTVGVILLSGNTSLTFNKRLKNLINPNMIAFILGILTMTIQIKLPAVIQDSLSQIGKTTSVISMLYIGALLAQTDLRGLIKRFDIYALSLNKLFIIPFILLLFIQLTIQLTGLQLSQLAKFIIVLESGMPCMTMVVILAKHFDADDQSAAENVFISTIISLFSLPFIYFLLLQF